MKIKHFLVTVLMLMLALPAHAELEINVRGASRNPMPIAIPEMLGNTSNIFSKIMGNDYGDKIREVIMADLDRSGLFKVIPETVILKTLLPLISNRNLLIGRLLKHKLWCKAKL